MSTDDSRSDGDEPTEGVDRPAEADVAEEGVRDRLESEADRAVERFDEGVVDLLAWVLDTETRARIYVQLRRAPFSTSDEIADGTGLYPSTVREALAELHEEGRVTRRKRENGTAGNNPYEYRAIPPSDLVSEVVDDVQSELNAVCNLDSLLGTSSAEESRSDGPVTITVDEESADE